eukprot:c4830_g1_i1.p1 GENE.c4830_g1_i1~~c4830_g1_i1.p1  ORF type:complete len:899 (-),score=231.49 c4830_g1_i1:91-2415(-)
MGDNAAVLFGGADIEHHFSDTWIFQGTTLDWTDVTHQFKVSPGPRDVHGAASLAQGTKIVIFGGYGEYDTLDDTWLLVNETSRLSWYQIASEKHPLKRYRFAMTALNDTAAVLFGGLCADDIPLQDTWVFNLNDPNYWSPLDVSTLPPRRSSASMTMTASNKVFMFGGMAQSFRDDSWLLFKNQGKLDWKQLFPGNVNPEARSGMSMNNVGNNWVVMFGGGSYEPSLKFGDTWLSQIECPPGFSKHGSSDCVPCDIHSFYNTTTRTCMRCPGQSMTNGNASIGVYSCNQCDRSYCHSYACTSLIVKPNSAPMAMCDCPSYMFLPSSHDCATPVVLYIIVSCVSVAVLIILFVVASYCRQRAKATVRKVMTEHLVVLKYKDEQLKLMKRGWNIDTSELKFDELVAQGGSGTVWRGKWAPLREDVAIKVMSPMPSDDFDEDPSSMLNIEEISLMQRVRHPRIVLFFGAGTRVDAQSASLFVVTQFMAEGSLEGVLRKALNKTLDLPWKLRLQYARDVAEGMAFLHDQKYLHRDLKSGNVLCEKGGRCKIADFGLARLVTNVQNRTDKREPAKKGWGSQAGSNGNNISTETAYSQPQSISAHTSSSGYTVTHGEGTPPWMAPEIATGRPQRIQINSKVDVYAYGVLLWEIMTCRQPWGDMDKDMIYEQVIQGNRPEITPEDRVGVPSGFERLLAQCWDGTPSVRPEFKDIIVRLDEIFQQEGFDRTTDASDSDSSPKPTESRIVATARSTIQAARSTLTRNKPEENDVYHVIPEPSI